MTDPRAAPEQLAQVLEERVKEDPNRFVHVSACGSPANANPVYLERTLDALKDAAVASDLKLKLCRKAFAESAQLPVAARLSPTCSGIWKTRSRMTPSEYSTGSPRRTTTPRSKRWRQDAGGGQKYYNGDVHFHGINTTRGQAAGAIGDLILRNATYIGRFRTTLDKMVRDPSAAVLSCVAGTLRAVAFHDTSLGMSLFQGMDLSEDRLLATHARLRIRSWLPARRPRRMAADHRADARIVGSRCPRGGCTSGLHRRPASRERRRSRQRSTARRCSRPSRRCPGRRRQRRRPGVPGPV